MEKIKSHGMSMINIMVVMIDLTLWYTTKQNKISIMKPKHGIVDLLN